MQRRRFLQSLGAASVGSLLTWQQVEARQKPGNRKAKTAPRKTLLFWDRWHLEQQENLKLSQGKPVWQPEATFHNPEMKSLDLWPTVYRHAGGWRMLYSVKWKPYTLMMAESDDGRHWRPANHPQIQPPDGKKLAPNHLFTLEGGSGGGVYLDPLAEDGFPFKVYAHQHGEPVLRRALADPQHRWHEVAKRDGVTRYLHDEITLVSPDGLNWKIQSGYEWGLPDWHPEPPLFGYYHAASQRHMMTVRPGWGDRRVCLQSTPDFQTWSGPELLLQPDFLDDELVEFYGMPVFPLGHQYVGLLWVARFSTSEPTFRYNKYIGPLEAHLVYTYDGLRFTRASREPFVPLTPQPEVGSSAIQSACLVETDDEVRIYSGGGKSMHGQRLGEKFAPTHGILLHTLRKDGFTFLQSHGDWARLLTKPLTIFEPEISLNAAAPFGEVIYQLTDINGKPLAGYTFAECHPLKHDDQLRWPLRWQEKENLAELVGKVFRLEVKLRNAQLYSLQAAYHFLDAQDWQMLREEEPIDPSLFDF